MDPIVTEATSHLPAINFQPDGSLSLEGRSIPENVLTFYDPLIEFGRNLTNVDVQFKVNLEYFNTATSKKLMELFKTLDANNKIGKIMIHWHFEEGDEDCAEMGEIYEESLLRADFRYHEYAELQEP